MHCPVGGLIGQHSWLKYARRSEETLINFTTESCSFWSNLEQRVVEKEVLHMIDRTSENSLVCNHVFGHGKKCYCEQKAHLILLYGCGPWPVRTADERMLVVFYNDCIRRILYARRRDCIPTAELRRRLRFTRKPSQLVQRSVRWFGPKASRPDLLSTYIRQLKTWVTTLSKYLESIPEPPAFGYTRCQYKASFQDIRHINSQIIQHAVGKNLSTENKNSR